MLPRISPDTTLQKNYQNYLMALRNTAFNGEIRTDYAARLTVATDNSIYQVIPQAVIYPRNTADIAALLQLSQQENFRTIQFTPRGGGTGTNGQSLSSGIIIDCSKYMRTIIELNLTEQWVRVQPGVVLDQLNDYLRQHGVHFAPEISTSNRATIGGMVNTDACGIGSKVLGRTCDHVLELTCVLSDGNVLNTTKMNSRFAKIKDLLEQHRDLILEKFIDVPRTLNGYNLKNALQSQNFLNFLLCGSEGTLAVISECKLKLTPIPASSQLVVVQYRSFEDALRAPELQGLSPIAVETIDEKLIDLARQEPFYFHIKDFIGDASAVNLVEFAGDDKEEIAKTIATLCSRKETALGFYVAKDAAEEKLLWNLRKKSVGLISKKISGSRRPIPFIEDTAVPPKHLANYIAELKKLLDAHGLIYGMYGHVDAGCVHVRPALDLKTQDEKLIRELSDEVVALLKKYQGILWGEHGQGHRCEYGPSFFGDTLYQVVRQIKTLFDPFDQLNPGKIAVSTQGQHTLVKLEGPLRGHFDKQISTDAQKEYSNAMACNGNGACFSYDTQEAICPSYKVTLNRVHSPKGRAVLMREWLRLAPQKIWPVNIFKKIFYSLQRKPDFSKEVYEAMSGCLGCKACATQCPLNVDVPDFKSKFLEIYHYRYLRPLRDYVISRTESIARFQAHFPRFFNWILQTKLMKWFLVKTINLVDPPLVTSGAKPNSVPLSQATVILLQDAFNSFYEPDVLTQAQEFLTRSGFAVHVAPFFANGKPLHAKGFLRDFAKLVKKNVTHLRELARANIPMIGLDPSITLTYRDEYQKIVGAETLGFRVQLLQEFLSDHLQNIKMTAKENKKYYLLSHCTEKTACPTTELQWKKIFEAAGLTLIPLAAGCCGMAGSYGHEAEHAANSKNLFAMDWQRYIEENQEQILATGYSCRSQAKRLTDKKLKHPIQIL